MNSDGIKRFFVASTATFTNPSLTGIYNASKAALHMLDSTLRLELAPLHISVLTVVTGAIETSFMNNIKEPQFPPDSHYLAIEEKAKALARGEDGYPRTKREVYAENVVKDVLAGKTGKVWHGANATLTRAVNVVAPVWVVVCHHLILFVADSLADFLHQDRILSSGTGMDKL
jgi:1-acylglycerone phosphate reductase